MKTNSPQLYTERLRRLEAVEPGSSEKSEHSEHFVDTVLADIWVWHTVSKTPSVQESL